MKTRYSVLALVASIALIGAGCSTTTPENNSTTTGTDNTVTTQAEPMRYKDFRMGITLYYPADWKTQGNEETGSIVFYPSTQENLEAGTGTNMGLSMQDLSSFPPITLAQYTQIITDDTLARLTDASIVSTENIMIGGLEGGVLTYVAQYPEVTDKLMKIRHAYVMKDKKAYLMTFTALEEDFDTYLPHAIQIVESFQFDN